MNLEAVLDLNKPEHLLACVSLVSLYVTTVFNTNKGDFPWKSILRTQSDTNGNTHTARSFSPLRSPAFSFRTTSWKTLLKDQLSIPWQSTSAILKALEADPNDHLKLSDWVCSSVQKNLPACENSRVYSLTLDRVGGLGYLLSFPGDHLPDISLVFLIQLT